jgi:hypothetical protein
MLTGQRAFAGPTTPDVLEAIVKGDADWAKLPAQVSPTIQKLLRRCLVKDRKQRLRAIGEARIALESPGKETALSEQPALRSLHVSDGFGSQLSPCSASPRSLWALSLTDTPPNNLPLPNGFRCSCQKKWVSIVP